MSGRILTQRMIGIAAQKIVMILRILRMIYQPLWLRVSILEIPLLIMSLIHHCLTAAGRPVRKPGTTITLLSQTFLIVIHNDLH
jgi:hypothetical protein